MSETFSSGGLVSCRSVKLLDECEEDDGGVTRDGWWQARIVNINILPM